MRAFLSSLVICLALAATAYDAEKKTLPCPETPAESHLRAGCPQTVWSHARPSDSPNYSGYYVGGGAAVRGQPRCPQEGTWGWDYLGLFPKNVALYWWHGDHRQGGGGAYATDHK